MVLGHEVRSKPAFGLRTLDDLEEELETARPVRLERPRVGKRSRQHVLEAAIGRLHRADPFHVRAEAGPPVGRVERLLGRERVVGQATLEARGDEVLARREAPVEGTDPDTRSRRDVLEGDLESAFGECRPGGIDDSAAVAFGIAPERLRRGLGWLHTVSIPPKRRKPSGYPPASRVGG